MKRLFDPPTRTVKEPLPEGMAAVGDRHEGAVYVYDDNIILAVNVALATQRPLLVAGPPGSGKSSLALNIAQVLGWRYEDEVLTPRTEARDLLWRFDALARLRDAQAKKLLDDKRYVKRGVIWRAFDGDDDRRRCVVLLDEIDKADPDVPNSLLEVLANLSFTIAETGAKVTVEEGSEPFIVLTTNLQRDLPRPFLRRCVLLRLEHPDRDRLREIAAAHGFDSDAPLTADAIGRVLELAGDAKAAGDPVPSAAELIDVLRAADRLEVGPGDEVWQDLLTVALVKPGLDGR